MKYKFSQLKILKTHKISKKNKYIYIYIYIYILCICILRCQNKNAIMLKVYYCPEKYKASKSIYLFIYFQDLPIPPYKRSREEKLSTLNKPRRARRFQRAGPLPPHREREPHHEALPSGERQDLQGGQGDGRRRGRRTPWRSNRNGSRWRVGSTTAAALPVRMGAESSTLPSPTGVTIPLQRRRGSEELMGYMRG
ncbi:hypothetical protein HPP92_003864 [Vanilla planifolia]|uniref:Uncharacterized protein n=1 Tax=Vanilla planifolia TaxID=51239 RepID=A0A835SH86_VANPL|nr:hypothetical protein HPP92_003864 [Vanilla planifolia]